MPITDHPNVFRYEGRFWASTEPRETAHAQLVELRRWDAATARAQRWWVAIVIGTVVGVGVVLGGGIAISAPPVIYLFALPIGFAFGAVLGALVNKRFNPAATSAATGERPRIPELVKVPQGVIRRLDNDTPIADVLSAIRGGR